MNRKKEPHLVGTVLVGLYAIAFLLSWLKGGFGIFILGLPFWLGIDKTLRTICVAVANSSPSPMVSSAGLVAAVLLNMTILYFAAWGLTRLLIDRGKEGNT